MSKFNKVVFIAYSIGESSTNDYFTAVIDEWKDKGWKVVIFTDKGENSYSEDLTILRWPSKRPTRLKDAIFLFKQLNRYNPSVVIANFSSVNLMTVISMLVSVPIRIAWIRTLSTQLDSSSQWKLKRKSLVYKCATDIFVNSNAMLEDARKVYNISTHKMHIIPNAVKLPDISFTEKNEKQLVYVGRLHWSKGVDILIKAMSRSNLIYQSWKLYIIGGGEEEKKLRQLIEELGLNNNVELIGKVSKKEVLEYFKKSQFSVVPSIEEAFGYTVIESMSVGTPVIGSNTGGIKDIISDNIDGLLFESKNIESLASKMDIMAMDESLRKKLGNNAHKKIQEEYEVKSVAAFLVDTILSHPKLI